MILYDNIEYDKKTVELFITSKKILRAEVDKKNPMQFYKEFKQQLKTLVEDLGAHDYENNALVDKLINQDVIRYIFFRQIRSFDELKKLVCELQLSSTKNV